MTEIDLITIPASATGLLTFEVINSHPIFWQSFAEKTWEPQTIELLRQLLSPGMNYVDVGAWIGPTCLVALALGANVIAYEPDPVALKILEANTMQNPQLPGKIQIIPCALGKTAGSATLSSNALGDSMSSLIRNSDQEIQVNVLDANEWARSDIFQKADLIKVDIEGGEYHLFKRIAPILKTARPRILLSIHGYIFYRDTKSRNTINRVRQRTQNIFKRLRLLTQLCHYNNVKVFDKYENSWKTLRRKQLAIFILSFGEYELFIFDND